MTEGTTVVMTTGAKIGSEMLTRLAHQWSGAHPACSKEIDAVCTFNREDINQMNMYWLYASTDDELPIANLAKFGFGKRQ